MSTSYWRPDMEELLAYETRTELAHRSNDGVEISLLWERGTNELAVVVVDHRSDDAFELGVESAEAMDAFNHPFAYAARRGVAYDMGLREPAHA